MKNSDAAFEELKENSESDFETMDLIELKQISIDLKIMSKLAENVYNRRCKDSGVILS